MGVWLGPMGKVKDQTIYPGSALTARGFKYTPSGFSPNDGEAKAPSFANSVASISTNYSAVREGYMNTSGLLVSQAVDLTKYKSVKFGYANFAHGHNAAPVIFYVSTSDSSFDDTRDVYANAVTDGSEATLDVSALNGAYYIGILLFAGGGDTTTSVTINSITVTAD